MDHQIHKFMLVVEEVDFLTGMVQVQLLVLVFLTQPIASLI